MRPNLPGPRATLCVMTRHSWSWRPVVAVVVLAIALLPAPVRASAPDQLPPVTSRPIDPPSSGTVAVPTGAIPQADLPAGAASPPGSRAEGRIAAGADPQGAFVLGSGQAIGSLLVAVARTGNIPIPFPLSQSGALYQGIDAGATSRALRPPPGPASPVSSPSRPAEESPIPPNPLLVSVTARSSEGENGSAKDETMVASPPEAPVAVGVQRQEASADRAPSARATTTSSSISVPGALGLFAGRSTAGAAIRGRERVADAEVVIASLELGPVRLDGLRWAVEHRSGERGATLASEAVFSLAGASVAGQAVPVLPERPEEVFSALNAALAPLGLALEAPRLQPGESSAVVTPLVVRVFGSEAGKRGLAPAVGALQPAREPLAEALLALDARFGLLLTGVDVLVGVLAGSNSIALEVGGAAATTEGLVYESPFGSALLPAFPSIGAVLSSQPSETTLSEEVEGDPYLLAADEEARMQEVRPDEARKPVTRTVRRVVRPPGQPSSDDELASEGLASAPRPTDRAMVVGLLGLLVALVLAVADRARPRRA